MEGSPSVLTLEHREELASWAQDLASYDNWHFSPEGTVHCCSAVLAVPAIALD